MKLRTQASTASVSHCTDTRVALHSTAQHCTALHSTARHCTALHSTARHCPDIGISPQARPARASVAVGHVVPVAVGLTVLGRASQQGGPLGQVLRAVLLGPLSVLLRLLLRGRRVRRDRGLCHPRLLPQAAPHPPARRDCVEQPGAGTVHLVLERSSKLPQSWALLVFLNFFNDKK